MTDIPGRYEDARLVEAFAIAMHKITCGDWRAAGYDTQQRFRTAAAVAVSALACQGLDMLSVIWPEEAA